MPGISAARWVAFAAACACSAAFLNGVTGTTRLDYAKRQGANAVRVYDAWQLSQVRDCALGLSLMVYVDMADPAGFVNRNKGIPCVAVWVIGNELDAHGDPNAQMASVANAARAVKAADPGRTTTTCLAGPDRLGAFMNNARSAVDALCVNCYGCSTTLFNRLVQAGYRGNFILGEFGVDGWWEIAHSGNPAMPYESTSTQKAIATAAAYAGSIGAAFGNPQNGIVPIGTFAFSSEIKLEATPTWFSLWTHTPGIGGDGLVPVIDRWAVLRGAWQGNLPAPAGIPAFLAGQGIPLVRGVTVANGDGRVAPGAGFTVVVHMGSPPVGGPPGGGTVPVGGGDPGPGPAVDYGAIGARGPWIVIWDIRADLSVTGTGAEPPVVRNFVSGPSGNDGKIVTQMTAPGGGTYRLKGIVFPQGANGQFSVDSSQYNEGAVVVSAQLYVG